MLPGPLLLFAREHISEHSCFRAVRIRYAAAGVNVAMGCDGACSSDGQDLLESLKLGTILQTAKTPEYRDWPAARHTALQLGAANGYTAVGMKDQGGVLKVR